MIHMSQSAHDAIMAFPEFITQCRGDICIKVKHSFYVALEITFYPFFLCCNTYERHNLEYSEKLAR